MSAVLQSFGKEKKKQEARNGKEMSNLNFFLKKIKKSDVIVDYWKV